MMVLPYTGYRSEFRITVVFVLLCLIVPLSARSGPETDTLEATRQLVSEGKVGKAFRTIRGYKEHHPDDFNTAWLYGKVAYLNHRISLSKKQYGQAIRLSPDNYYLRLDYADFLVNTGEFDSATRYLDEYLRWDSGNGQALLLKSKIAYWSLDFQPADSILSLIREEDAAFPMARSLRSGVSLATSWWLSLRAEASTDNQPLTGLIPAIEAGKFIYPALSPYLKLSVPLFWQGSSPDYGWWFQAGNYSAFPKPGLTLNLTAGVISLPPQDKTSWTAGAELTKTFLKHLPVTLALSRNPYFWTASAADSAIFEERISLSGGWNDSETIFGEGSVTLSYFPVDGNTVLTASGWAFAPPLKWKKGSVRFGYGFQYANSSTDHFVPRKTMEEILAEYSDSYEIEGVYDPYFTPQDQLVHSLLLSIRFKPWNAVSIDLSGNFGLLAKADIPFLYLDQEAGGNLIIRKGFSRQSYFPVQADASFQFKLTERTWMDLFYKFMSTYYFTRHEAGIGLKFYFPHDRK